MVLTVSFGLSSVTGLVCHRRERICLRSLDTSVGASGPHDFAVRISAVRPQHISVHRIPFPTSVTIASRPSLGTRRDAQLADLGQLGSGIFLRKGMDSRTGDLPVRQIQWPLLRVIANEAKQSITLQREKGWIASSRALLAMTGEGDSTVMAG